MKLLNIFKYNIIHTIHFNFKMLPFKKAIKLPIIFKRKTRFNNLKGQLIINGEISRGMIIIQTY